MAPAKAPGLHGSDDSVDEEAGKYKSPPEYSDQGDERVVRDLLFSYIVEGTDLDGRTILSSRDAVRGTKLKTSQIGLIALKQGEGTNSFYTSDQLDVLSKTGQETVTPGSEVSLDEQGEHELADWLQTGKDGGAYTVDEVLEAVGNSKDLAHRMLAAENIATSGDPRATLEAGLTRVIEG